MAAPAQDNAANTELISFLATVLGVRKGALSLAKVSSAQYFGSFSYTSTRRLQIVHSGIPLVQGARSREKAVQVSAEAHLTAPDADERIRNASKQ